MYTSLEKKLCSNELDQDNNQWMRTHEVSPSSIEEEEEDSMNSIGSCSTVDSSIEDDASSSSVSSSSSSFSSHSQSNGPLYELQDLMAQLPIKRALSKYYQGRSQSYTSLANVKSLEDLVKKVSPNHQRYKMKSCKSYGACLDGQKYPLFSPKATISKKGSKGINISNNLLSSNLGKKSKVNYY